jgi:hypothetical protein
VSPAAKSWGKIDNGFGDGSHGYPYDEQTRKDSYKVWDGGAKSDMKATKRLYKIFSGLIEHYDDAAWKYLSETFEPILKEAKSKGWEATPLSQTFPLDFPYEVER